MKKHSKHFKHITIFFFLLWKIKTHFSNDFNEFLKQHEVNHFWNHQLLVNIQWRQMKFYPNLICTLGQWQSKWNQNAEWCSYACSFACLDPGLHGHLVSSGTLIQSAWKQLHFISEEYYWYKKCLPPSAHSTKMLLSQLVNGCKRNLW